MKKVFKASMLALPMFIVAGTAYSQTATVQDTGGNDVVVYTKDAADTIFAEKQAWLDGSWVMIQQPKMQQMC